MDFEFLEMSKVELKYCERCGGLWLRPLGCDEVYCKTCAPIMAQFPARLAKRGSQIYFRRADDAEAGADDIYAITLEGGNA